MPTEQFANNAQTTLAAAVTAGATTITVSATTGFPSGPQFRIRVGDELMLVTAVSGATWTVTRGAEGTVAAPHAAGDSVTQVLTAGVLTALTGLTTDQPANTIYAGPAAGGPASPGFRSLVAADIPDGGITNAKLRDSAALSVVGRAANTAGNVADIAAASDGQVLRRSGATLGFGPLNLAAAAGSVTGVLPVASGGTGVNTCSRGDLLYGQSAGSLALLPGNPSVTRMFLTQAGTGSLSNAPGWSTIASTDLPLATQSDQEAATGTATVVTPGRQHFHPSACKAWAYFTVSGGVVTLRAGYGVSSVTRTGTGTFAVTWATPFSSADYALCVTPGHQAGAGNAICNPHNQTAGGVTLFFTGASFTVVTDPVAGIHVAAFGDR